MRTEAGLPLKPTRATHHLQPPRRSPPTSVHLFICRLPSPSRAFSGPSSSSSVGGSACLARSWWFYLSPLCISITPRQSGAACEATKPCDKAQHAEQGLGSGEALALSEKMKVTEYIYRGSKRLECVQYVGDLPRCSGRRRFSHVAKENSALLLKITVVLCFREYPTHAKKNSCMNTLHCLCDEVKSDNQIDSTSTLLYMSEPTGSAVRHRPVHTSDRNQGFEKINHNHICDILICRLLIKSKYKKHYLS